MKIGDILLMDNKGFAGWIIRKFTKQEYSHCVCYLGGEYVIESDWGGVKITPLNEFKNYEVYRYKDATEEQLRMATQWMISQQGCGYDWGGILGIALSIIGKKKGNPWDNKTKYWCSELIADGYLNAGIDIPVDDNTWKTTPGDFAEMEGLNLIIFKNNE